MSINVVIAITKHALSSVGVINALKSNWHGEAEAEMLDEISVGHGSPDRRSTPAEES